MCLPRPPPTPSLPLSPLPPSAAPPLPPQPKAVHINSSTLDVENLRFMYLPKDRRALVHIPVSLWGEEAAPGVKGGAWLHVVNRTVPFMCPGWAVKPTIELDVRKMNVRGLLGVGGWVGWGKGVSGGVGGDHGGSAGWCGGP